MNEARRNILNTIGELPEKSLEEVSDFLSCLKMKNQKQVDEDLEGFNELLRKTFIKN